MTVAELIVFLQTQPQDLPVAYEIYSEYARMQFGDIKVLELGRSREDGWVSRKRPDQPSQKYIVFPGN